MDGSQLIIKMIIKTSTLLCTIRAVMIVRKVIYIYSIGGGIVMRIVASILDSLEMFDARQRNVMELDLKPSLSIENMSALVVLVGKYGI